MTAGHGQGHPDAEGQVGPTVDLPVEGSHRGRHGDPVGLGADLLVTGERWRCGICCFAKLS